MSDLGGLIFNRRMEKGLSQQSLAELVDVDNTYISRIENDKLPSPPMESTLLRLAHALEIDPNEVIIAAGRIDWGEVKRLARQSPLLTAFLRDLPYYTQEQLQEVQRVLGIGE